MYSRHSRHAACPRAELGAERVRRRASLVVDKACHVRAYSLGRSGGGGVAECKGRARQVFSVLLVCLKHVTFHGPCAALPSRGSLWGSLRDDHEYECMLVT